MDFSLELHMELNAKRRAKGVTSYVYLSTHFVLDKTGQKIVKILMFHKVKLAVLLHFCFVSTTLFLYSCIHNI